MIYNPVTIWYRAVDLKNELKYAWQRARRGYDDTALWGLYSYVTKIALPALQHYKEHKMGHPIDLPSLEAWQAEIDIMIAAFELIKSDDDGEVSMYYDLKKNREENAIMWRKNKKIINSGLHLFATRFLNLWD